MSLTKIEYRFRCSFVDLVASAPIQLQCEKRNTGGNYLSTVPYYLVRSMCCFSRHSAMIVVYRFFRLVHLFSSMVDGLIYAWMGGRWTCICMDGRLTYYLCVDGRWTYTFTYESVLRKAGRGRDPAKLRRHGRTEGRIRLGLGQGDK